MRRAAAVIAFACATLALTGCGGETWEELAENRERCESLGGTYTQWQDGLSYKDHSRCNFDREVVAE